MSELYTGRTGPDAETRDALPHREQADTGDAFGAPEEPEVSEGPEGRKEPEGLKGQGHLEGPNGSEEPEEPEDPEGPQDLGGPPEPEEAEASDAPDEVEEVKGADEPEVSSEGLEKAAVPEDPAETEQPSDSDSDTSEDGVVSGEFANAEEAGEHGPKAWKEVQEPLPPSQYEASDHNTGETSFESDDRGGEAEEPEQPTMDARADQPTASGEDLPPAVSDEPLPDTSTPLARDQADPEGAFLDKAWGRVRNAVFDSGSVEESEDVYATVERPKFNEMRVEGIDVPLVEYGAPLERRDGDRVPLFDGPPRREQTEQGSLGDCGVISTLGAVAGHRPDDIANCIRENDDGTYDVVLHQVKHSFDGDWRHYEATGGKTVLTVTPDLPVSSLNPESPAYASTGGGEMAWVAVMEKAFAGVDQTWGDERAKGGGGYLRLDLGSNPDIRAEMLTQLTGLSAYTEDFPKGYDYHGNSPERQILDTLREKLDSGFPVLVGTKSEDLKRPESIKGLIHGHAYEVTAVDERGQIHLRNPHNAAHPKPLTVEEFRENLKNRYTTLE